MILIKKQSPKLPEMNNKMGFKGLNGRHHFFFLSNHCLMVVLGLKKIIFECYGLDGQHPYIFLSRLILIYVYTSICKQKKNGSWGVNGWNHFLQ